MQMNSYADARALSRQFFPTWSRRARARWVLAKMKAQNPKVPISSGWSHDLRAYWYQRTLRPPVRNPAEPLMTDEAMRLSEWKIVLEDGQRLLDRRAR